MAVVFYDTETTGKSTKFDQILQFAAIRTDSELNEIDRFEIRCRLLPHIVPAPGALCVTGVSIEQLTDSGLPSHYEMVRTIRGKLLSWSPTLFVGWNSLHFDEHLLRQTFYQTLHPLYLTNTNGNTRTDAMRMVQAASICAGNAITTPFDDKGTPEFKLERIASAKGHAHINAHDAMADVEATIHMCRVVRDRAPDIWSAFMRFSQKAAAANYICEEPIFSLSDVFFGKPYSSIVTAIGQNSENDLEHYVFDLAIDPETLRDLDDTRLAARLSRSPRVVRIVKCNGSPMLMPADEAPDSAQAKQLGLEELERRANALRLDTAFCERLVAALESTRKVYEPSAHVEEQIYDRFIESADAQRLEAFHDAPWEERAGLVAQLSDPRLIELGRRLIYFERPDVLDDSTRRDIELSIARRVTDDSGNTPWLTLAKAVEEAELMLADAAEDAQRAILESVQRFFGDQIARTAALLG